MADLRIDYDDHQIDVMDKVNEALKSRGLEFRDDGQEHDGYVLYTLVATPEEA